MAVRRNKEPPVPMPKKLPRDAWLVVEDEKGRLLRVELLPPGTDLPKRLGDAAAEYAAQGWTGQPSPGRWTFVVRRGTPRTILSTRRAGQVGAEKRVTRGGTGRPTPPRALAPDATPPGS